MPILVRLPCGSDHLKNSRPFQKFVLTGNVRQTPQLNRAVIPGGSGLLQMSDWRNNMIQMKSCRRGQQPLQSLFGRLRSAALLVQPEESVGGRIGNDEGSNSDA